MWVRVGTFSCLRRDSAWHGEGRKSVLTCIRSEYKGAGRTMILQIKTEALSYERLYSGAEASALPALMLKMLAAFQIHHAVTILISASRLLGTAVRSGAQQLGARLIGLVRWQ